MGDMTSQRSQLQISGQFASPQYSVEFHRSGYPPARRGGHHPFHHAGPGNRALWASVFNL